MLKDSWLCGGCARIHYARPLCPDGECNGGDYSTCPECYGANDRADEKKSMCFDCGLELDSEED